MDEYVEEILCEVHLCLCVQQLDGLVIFGCLHLNSDVVGGIRIRGEDVNPVCVS